MCQVRARQGLRTDYEARYYRYDENDLIPEQDARRGRAQLSPRPPLKKSAHRFAWRGRSAVPFPRKEG